MTKPYDDPETWPASRRDHALLVFASALIDYIADNVHLWGAPTLAAEVDVRLDQILAEANLAPGSVGIAEFEKYASSPPYRITLRWLSAIDRLGGLV